MSATTFAQWVALLWPDSTTEMGMAMRRLSTELSGALTGSPTNLRTSVIVAPSNGAGSRTVPGALLGDVVVGVFFGSDTGGDPTKQNIGAAVLGSGGDFAATCIAGGIAQLSTTSDYTAYAYLAIVLYTPHP